MLETAPEGAEGQRRWRWPGRGSWSAASPAFTPLTRSKATHASPASRVRARCSSPTRWQRRRARAGFSCRSWASTRSAMSLRPCCCTRSRRAAMASSELPPERPRARLIRTRRGRLIGGVCSGLGAHFGVDPILLRIAFVGLAIFGGVGFWLYLAFLLLVPEEGASAPPLRLRQL